MKAERISLLRELCFIAHKRNTINQRRSKARWRKAYYENAIKVVEAFKESNSELRRLEKWIANNHKSKDTLAERVRADKITASMNDIRYMWLLKRKTQPNKWLDMGPMKLRALALKAEAEYAKAKYDTMVLSEKTTKRIKQVLKELDAFVCYNNGYITAICTQDNDLAADRGEIADYAKEHELGKAIDTMLKER